MCFDQGPSWRQRGWPRPVNQAQDFGEQGSWDGDLRQLKGDVAAVAHDLRANLDELLPRRGQGPVLDLIGQRQCLLVMQ